MANLDFLSNNYQDTRTYQEKVKDQIITNILNGTYRRGSRLIEKNLTEKYNLSRTPVREILNQLSETGLVEIIPNRGSFVIGITNRDIDDLFTLRYILFPQAVKWAIERVTEEEMQSIEEAINFMRLYSQTGDQFKFLKIYFGYNSLIYETCGNNELANLLKRQDKILSIVNENSRMAESDILDVQAEYNMIHEAFLKRDKELGFEAAQIYVYKSMLRR